jgi:hypothetical protein
MVVCVSSTLFFNSPEKPEFNFFNCQLFESEQDNHDGGTMVCLKSFSKKRV